MDDRWAKLRKLAKARFGVTTFRPGQQALIEAVLAGNDALGILPTGAGKSLCFQLPSLVLPKATVVVSPLLALMQDQQEKLAEANIDAAKLDSTLTATDEHSLTEEIRDGEHALIYVTPERLEHPEYIELLKARGVSLLVVDEAHCVSQWGHDFRPAYLALRDARRQLGDPPVLALTATATQDVIDDITQQLGMTAPTVVNTGVDRPNLIYAVHPAVNRQRKLERLEKLITEERGSCAVYVATIREANELLPWLVEREPTGAVYHGKLPMREREDVLRRFMSGEARVIIATKAFGLGVDKHDLRLVVHWHFPDSVESYYQEAGRGGRDGKRARAELLYQLEDRRVQAFFLGGKYPHPEETKLAWSTLQELAAEKPTIAKLAEETDIGDKRIKVVVAQLEGAGLVKRSRGRLTIVRDADESAMESALEAYEERAHSDRERLESMMRYAESVECRVQWIRRYFGDEAGEVCKRCDNCTSPRVEAPRKVKRARKPRPAPRPFEVGATVQHAKFGTGEVVELGEHAVVVAFAGGQRRIAEQYLRPVAAAA